MNKYFKFAAMAFTALALSAVGFAQTRLDVPFAFEVSGTKLDPGTYKVNASDKPIVLISADDHSRQVFAMENSSAISSNPDALAKLVFKRVGNEYFLSGVYESGPTPRIHLYRDPKRIKELKAANAGEPVSEVVIASK
jgi:hypothetical protein